MTLAPFKGRCHTCGHDHDAETQHWRDVLDLATRADGRDDVIAELRAALQAMLDYHDDAAKAADQRLLDAGYAALAKADGSK